MAPELPEVETIKRDLEQAVIGRRIVGTLLATPEIVQTPTPEAFVAALPGKTIERVERRAKYLFLHLSGDWVWTLHLMVEGQLLLLPSDTAALSDTKLVVGLDDDQDLRLRDVAGYARTWLTRREHLEEVIKLREFGPEPLHPSFDFALFKERLANRRGMIKPLLLNQRVIAGIGNIYADEALFRARIRPDRKVGTLSESELYALYESVVEVLVEGVRHRGTSAPQGMYRDLYGRKGEHQKHLRVFRRAGKPCGVCGGIVVETRVSGRQTFICEHCQH